MATFDAVKRALANSASWVKDILARIRRAHSFAPQLEPAQPESQPEPQPPESPQPQPEPAHEYVLDEKEAQEQEERLAAWSTPTVEPARLESQNRAMRRALERARRRHDQFVEPKGKIEKKRERKAAARKAKPVPTVTLASDPNDKIIADEWMEGDGQGRVLYEHSEVYGEFNFRDTILGQLERYWVYLERMKRKDPDAYGFYKHVGATLVPYISTGTNWKPRLRRDWKPDVEEYRSEIVLPPWFRQHWPAFGCIATGVSPHDEQHEMTGGENGMVLWCPKFLYYTKLATVPWMVQPVSGGHVYQMTVWWDRPFDPKIVRKYGMPQAYYIWVAPDNRIKLLKTREYRPGKIGQWWDWRYPDYAFNDWAQQHGLTVSDHLAHIFCAAVRHIEYAAYSMIRVAVSKGDMTAVFGLNHRRLPYFFQDRDITTTVNGFRKPIFHMVRAHERKDGTMRPTSFRGQREFTWAGYNVSITVPGRDHMMIEEFDVPAMTDIEEDEDAVRMEELGRRIKSWIKEGVGRRQ